MAGATAVPLSKKSQELFLHYYSSIQSLQNTTRSERRARLEKVDKEYQREVDLRDSQAKAKAANDAGDPSRYQDIVVPVVMPQVEAAVVHQTSVFLTGSPIFGVAAPPEFIDEGLQMEAIIEDNSIRGGWARELILFFRDGFKHNFAAMEVDWAREVTPVIETDLKTSLKEGVVKKTIWSGNKLKWLDPYNTFVDSRVPPTEVYKRGDFAGYTEFMTRIELKTFVASLPDRIIANIVPAFNSGLAENSGAKNSGAQNYYVPSINPSVTVEDNTGGTNWLEYAGLSNHPHRNQKIDYKDGYEVTRLYARVLPSEMELKIPDANTPQIYKLIIVNHSVIIYAERQTNAHGYLPILIGAPKEDGLGYQTKSLANNGSPFQSLATALMASIIASKRRAISDRMLYDPSRVSSAAINSPNASAKIPIRPSAYGSNLSDAVYHIPYREDQAASSMQQIQAVVGLSNNLAGQNQASQGQFVKGNKTLREYEDVMENAGGNDQLSSILLEAQVFIPIKHILKLNILQYQGGTSIYNRNKKAEVEIDPVALRRAVMDFKISDGLVPSEKILNSEAFSTALQVFGSSAQIASGYNIPPFFSYLMKSQGADISDFEKSPEQIAYEQAMQQWSALAQIAIEKGLSPEKSLPPQPLPQQFGYEPAVNKPAPKGATTEQQTSTVPPTGDV